MFIFAQAKSFWEPLLLLDPKDLLILWEDYQIRAQIDPQADDRELAMAAYEAYKREAQIEALSYHFYGANRAALENDPVLAQQHGILFDLQKESIGLLDPKFWVMSRRPPRSWINPYHPADQFLFLGKKYD